MQFSLEHRPCRQRDTPSPSTLASLASRQKKKRFFFSQLDAVQSEIHLECQVAVGELADSEVQQQSQESSLNLQIKFVMHKNNNNKKKTASFGMHH